MARVLFAVLAGLVLGCTPAGPLLVCRVHVPKEYQVTPFDPPPNGEPEPVRYSVAYEAFWWNCVVVRSRELGARCPFLCNGTPGATAGCSDGATAADEEIDGLLKTYDEPRVRKYLKSLAASPEASEKMRHYFGEGPRVENPSSD
jgi:hypothetical protein